MFSHLRSLRFLELHGNSVKCTCDYITMLRLANIVQISADCIHQRLDMLPPILNVSSLTSVSSGWISWGDCDRDCDNGAQLRRSICTSCTVMPNSPSCFDTSSRPETQCIYLSLQKNTKKLSKEQPDVCSFSGCKVPTICYKESNKDNKTKVIINQGSELG